MSSLSPFLKVAREIPQHWDASWTLWFEQRHDGSVFINCYGPRAKPGGVTVGQWRALLDEFSESSIGETVQIAPNAGEETTKLDLGDLGREIAALAVLMRKTSEKMKLVCAGNSEVESHASELAGAADIADTWVDGLNGGK